MRCLFKKSVDDQFIPSITDEKIIELRSGHLFYCLRNKQEQAESLRHHLQVRLSYKDSLTKIDPNLDLSYEFIEWAPKSVSRRLSFSDGLQDTEESQDTAIYGYHGILAGVDVKF